MQNEPAAEVGAPPVPRPEARPAADRAAQGSTAGAVGAPAAHAVPPAGPGRPGAPADPADRTEAGVAPVAARRRSRWLVPLLAALLALAVGVAGYLYVATAAYRERLAWTQDQARAIGTDLATSRAELEGATAELEAVRGQLAAAHERISALADEKARIGDDREAQAQLLSYQARVSEAAGTVASALDRCVRGQDQLITYLENATQYDPGELATYAQGVERLCQSASEANRALQAELADR